MNIGCQTVANKIKGLTPEVVEEKLQNKQKLKDVLKDTTNFEMKKNDDNWKKEIFGSPSPVYFDSCMYLGKHFT